MLRPPLTNLHLLGLDTKRRTYSRVNQAMQVASISSRFRLSELYSLWCSMTSGSYSGRLLRVRAMVEITMKEMLREATICEMRKRI